MHPNTVLRNFWRMERRPEVFVAMSFEERYKPRFHEVIEPAVQSLELAGQPLQATRVDISESGDSILTEIMDGISHAALILADVSSIGNDSVTGHPFRNGNVMYEVGVALACRQPQEVLLVRDDKDRFLFDVSTIPHMTLDFTKHEVAVESLRAELATRLKEAAFIVDAQVEIAIAGLTNKEVTMLVDLGNIPEEKSMSWEITGTVMSVAEMSLARLLDKQLINMTGLNPKSFPMYQLTALGRVVARCLSKTLQTVQGATKVEKTTDT